MNTQEQCVSGAGFIKVSSVSACVSYIVGPRLVAETSVHATGEHECSVNSCTCSHDHQKGNGAEIIFEIFEIM